MIIPTPLYQTDTSKGGVGSCTLVLLQYLVRKNGKLMTASWLIKWFHQQAFEQNEQILVDVLNSALSANSDPELGEEAVIRRVHVGVPKAEPDDACVVPQPDLGDPGAPGPERVAQPKSVHQLTAAGAAQAHVGIASAAWVSKFGTTVQLECIPKSKMLKHGRVLYDAEWNEANWVKFMGIWSIKSESIDINRLDIE